MPSFPRSRLMLSPSGRIEHPQLGQVWSLRLVTRDGVQLLAAFYFATEAEMNDAMSALKLALEASVGVSLFEVLDES